MFAIALILSQLGFNVTLLINSNFCCCLTPVVLDRHYGGIRISAPPLEYDVIVLRYVSRVNSRGKTLKLVRRVLFSWITLKKV